MKIVLIAAGTKRDNNFLNDIVATHEDDVELSGDGYKNFTVVQIIGLTKGEVDSIIQSKQPTIGGTQESPTWQDTGGIWHPLVIRPKYSSRLPVTVSQINNLKNVNVVKETKIAILNTVLLDNISQIPENLG